MIIEIECDEHDVYSPDVLEKALRAAIPSKEKELKYPVLRALKERSKDAYRARLRKMRRDIDKVLAQSIKKSFHDHSAPIHEAEAIAYERVKAALKRKGFREQDFDEGGRFYGWSTNALLDLARNGR